MILKIILVMMSVEATSRNLLTDNGHYPLFVQVNVPGLSMGEQPRCIEVPTESCSVGDLIDKIDPDLVGDARVQVLFKGKDVSIPADQCLADLGIGPETLVELSTKQGRDIYRLEAFRRLR